MADFKFSYEIGNQTFWTLIMADHIAIHEETAWQADHLLRESSVISTLWLQGANLSC
jgi:hypothetical protein